MLFMEFIPSRDTLGYKISYFVGFYLSCLIFLTILYLIWLKRFFSYYYILLIAFFVLSVFFIYSFYRSYGKDAITF